MNKRREGIGARAAESMAEDQDGGRIESCSRNERRYGVQSCLR